jgi:small subunit ribosomal protein S16
MLTIRMQRTGRSGHAQFRVVVQDSRFSPTSGRIVAYVGSYNPHTKIATIDKEKITGYLSSGAQPSPRVASLLKKEGVKLPSWVKIAKPSKKSVKHPEKLRRNRPAGEPAPVAKSEAEEAPSEEAPVEEIKAEEAPAEEVSIEEAPAEEIAKVEEKPVEEKAEPEAPAEEKAVEEEAKPAKEEKAEPKPEAKS